MNKNETLNCWRWKLLRENNWLLDEWERRVREKSECGSWTVVTCYVHLIQFNPITHSPSFPFSCLYLVLIGSNDGRALNTNSKPWSTRIGLKIEDWGLRIGLRVEGRRLSVSSSSSDHFSHCCYICFSHCMCVESCSCYPTSRLVDTETDCDGKRRKAFSWGKERGE